LERAWREAYAGGRAPEAVIYSSGRGPVIGRTARNVTGEETLDQVLFYLNVRA
jgi:hypothetical protein